MVDIVLISGSGILRDALSERLGHEPDVGVVSTFAGGADTLPLLSIGCSDVVICEAAQFGPVNGRQWTAAGAAVVLVAEPGDEQRLAQSVLCGARAWVLKDHPYDLLIHAVRCVASGGSHIPPPLLTELFLQLTSGHSNVQGAAEDSPLTARERQVLSALADGRTRAEVAAHLHVSTNTVRTHVRRILAKFEV
ncbi:MAG: LuxR C-terminal-related transcriptional regulator, partial [Mycobacteriaceae bacterium]